MFCVKRSMAIAFAAATILGAALPTLAQQPPAAAAAPAAQDDPARMDRDGKKICGYDLMTESERSGYKSTMYFTKDIKDRDTIRAESCVRMKKRAAEKGVKIDE